MGQKNAKKSMVGTQKSPKFGHICNFDHIFLPEINLFEIFFTIEKVMMAFSTSGLNHQT